MTNRQRPDIWIGWICIFGECIDSHPGKVGIMMTIDAKIEKDQFFLNNIFSAWSNDHFRIKPRCIYSLSCINYYLFYHLFFIHLKIRIWQSILKVAIFKSIVLFKLVQFVLFVAFVVHVVFACFTVSFRWCELHWNYK